jgi:hypothetical protein
MQNARPRLMFLCFLLGGIGMALALGLDVFALQADAVQTQGSVSAGLDLALGVPLLAIGVLVATGHLHGRRRPPVLAGGGRPPKDTWAQRACGSRGSGLPL